ncbi:MAG: hypothetical protein HKN21_16130 [Candidatus Eisenbacteria bacterium]|uniref:AsmA family protein n=1 Tax=Eiseniibacteriota bacterium TaxID=2212470 RepID=A0A7Y2EAL7_UNCEI|nr:hypothetical protein [Candidatus Eisenbacteria bacterium]
MKRKLGWGCFSGVLLLLVLIFVLPRFLDADALVRPVLTRIENASGYSVVVDKVGLRMGWNGARVALNDVTVISPDEAQTVMAKETSIHLKLLPLLKKRTELKRVEIIEPHIRLGRKDPEQSTSDEKKLLGVLALEEWEIKNGTFEKETKGGKFVLSEFDATGDFNLSDAGGTGTGRASLTGGTFVHEGETYPLAPTEVNWQLQVSPELDLFVLAPLAATSGDLRIDFQGRYERTEKYWQGALEGTLAPFDERAVRAWIPDRFRGAFDQLNARAGASTLGFYTDGETGEVTVKASLPLQSISSLPAPGEIPVKGSGSLQVHFPGQTTFQGKTEDGSGEVEGTWRMRGTDHEVSLKGQLQPNALSLWTPAKIDAGSVSFDLGLLGPGPFGPDNVPAITGTLSLQELTGRFEDYRLANLNGKIRINQNKVDWKDLSVKLGDAVLQGSGEGSLEEGRGGLKLRLRSERVRGRDLANLVAIPESLYNLDLSRLRMGVTLTQSQVELQIDDAMTAGGSLRGRAFVGDGGALDGSLDVSQVNMEQLAGQLGLNTVGLSGNGTAHLAFRVSKEGVQWKWDKMVGQGNLAVRQGAVLNVPELQNLGSMLKIKEITPERWPFGLLRGQFRLENGAYLLDEVKIQQTGIEWALTGRIGKTWRLSGVARIDPNLVSVPTELTLLIPFVQEPDGKIPVDFAVDGSRPNLSVRLDWEAVTRRAVEKARVEQEQDIIDALEKAVKDQDALERLKRIIRKGGN